jgi:hypothetical protein
MSEKVALGPCCPLCGTELESMQQLGSMSSIRPATVIPDIHQTLWPSARL